MMMDAVYWSRAMRADREREAAPHQRAAWAREVLRQPEPGLRRDIPRSLLFDTRRRHIATAWCCLTGAGA